MDEIELYPGFDKTCQALNTPIEPGIKPACDALNAMPDVHTLWSCEGHPEWKGVPYVTFIALQDTAFKISQLLGSAHESGRLYYCWRITANFREDGSLQYMIRPHDRRLNDDSLHWWSLRLWNRRALKNELNGLAQSLYGLLSSLTNAGNGKQQVNDTVDAPEGEDEIDANKKAYRKRVNKILRCLEIRLEYKWHCGYGEEISWNYRDAAEEFHQSTGCNYDSAQKYFGLIEAIAEWESLPAPPPKNVKDAIKLNGILYGRPQAFYRFPLGKSDGKDIGIRK